MEQHSADLFEGQSWRSQNGRPSASMASRTQPIEKHEHTMRAQTDTSNERTATSNQHRTNFQHHHCNHHQHHHRICTVKDLYHLQWPGRGQVFTLGSDICVAVVFPGVEGITGWVINDPVNPANPRSRKVSGIPKAEGQSSTYVKSPSLRFGGLPPRGLLQLRRL